MGKGDTHDVRRSVPSSTHVRPWSGALTRDQVTAASQSELLAICPHRAGVPRDAWKRLFSSAERDIGVLVYSGLFLAEDAVIQKILADKAHRGCGIDCEITGLSGIYTDPQQ